MNKKQADIDREDKQETYLKKREKARYLYYNTSCSVSRVARNIEVSQTTADHMITGMKEPQWVKQMVKEGKL